MKLIQMHSRFTSERVSQVRTLLGQDLCWSSTRRGEAFPRGGGEPVVMSARPYSHSPIQPALRARSGASSSALAQAGGAESMREVGAMSSEHVLELSMVVSRLQLQLLLGLGARVRRSVRAGRPAAAGEKHRARAIRG